MGTKRVKLRSSSSEEEGAEHLHEEEEDEENESASASISVDRSQRIRPTSVFLEFPAARGGGVPERVEPAFAHQVFPEDDVEDETLRDEDMVEELPLDYVIRYSSSWNAVYSVELHDEVDPEDVSALSARLEASPVGGPFLSPGTTASEDEPWELPGKGDVLCRIENKLGSFEVCFVPRVCDSEAGRVVLARGQALATWFIETAEPVAFQKADARWSLMYALMPDRRGLAAYVTVYPFQNLSRGDQPVVLRLCQIVVLPGLRGLGLGRALLRAFYALGRGDPRVYEMNLEDPCPACQRLRDQVDAADLRALGWFGSDADDFSLEGPAFRRELAKARDALKLAAAQLRRAVDVVRFAALRSRLSGSGPEDWYSQSDDEVLKRFRVGVKRRLRRRIVKESADAVLQADAPAATAFRDLLGDPERLKRKLEELFRLEVTEVLLPLCEERKTSL